VKTNLAVAALILFISDAYAEPADHCPTLPSGATLHWEYSQGPDFGVCYALASGSKDTAFGIYLGNFPSFNPEHATRVGSGIVGGRDVVWYRHGTGAAADRYSRDTIVTLDEKRRYLAHIWVLAVSEQQLQERLSILGRIRFRVP